MLALALSLFNLRLIGVPIGISVAGATSVMVLMDDFLSSSPCSRRSTFSSANIR